MCRGKSAGGRRCPGCVGRTGLDKHNERRRKNRAIRRNVVDWAEQQGIPSSAVRDLAAAPPKAVKEWAQNQGVDPEAFVEGVPASLEVSSQATPESSTHDDADTSYRTEYWCSEHLSGAIAAAVAAPSTPEETALLEQQPMGYDDPEEMGTNETQRVTFAGGLVGYHKPFDGVDTDAGDFYGHVEEPYVQPLHEVAAYRLAATLGEPWSQLVPPTVMRDVGGSWGSVQQHREGEPPMNPDYIDPEDLHAAAFFDALIGQQDRHHANMLVTSDSRLSLIDHGFCFAKQDDYCNASFLLSERRSEYGDEITPGERLALRQLLESEDLARVETMLEPARADQLRARATAMLATGRLVNAGEY